MEESIKKLIEDKYSVTLKTVVPGPRQFVAETYVLEIEGGNKYFCKIINHYTEITIKSLPVLSQLYDLRIKNINYPIKTSSGELYLRLDNLLIILFNFIEGVQQFGYSHGEYAELIAKIHLKSSEIISPIPKEEFSILYKKDFERWFEQSLDINNSDESAQKLREIISQYADEIRNDWKTFQSIAEECKNTNFNLVITHGDAPGNIIIAPNKDIYLIDWDMILLAPAERDIWFLAKSSEFLKAYQLSFPGYEVNSLAYKFYLYNRYFDDIQGFIAEILSDKSEEHKKKNLDDLKKDCFDEWLRPLIRSLN